MASQNSHVADLHTPEELVDNAEALFASGNPKMMRAAVLEAITALEAFVQSTVFSSLNGKLDTLLVQWLEDKTKMDFDSRLSVLTPVAVGCSVDKASALWSDYKKAKGIRNKVTHSGAKVSANDARFVIDTVYNWLAYLGSTLELEVALIGLKRYVEQAQVPINSEQKANLLIAEYFGQSKAASSLHEVSLKDGKRHLTADIVLKFGLYTVIVETKYSRNRDTQDLVKSAVEQTKVLMAVGGITQGVVVIFQEAEIPLGFDNVQKFHDGKVYSIVIKA